jgi:hypothetical protein
VRQYKSSLNIAFLLFFVEMATLETQLIKAVQEENLDEVRSLIERGNYYHL